MALNLLFAQIAMGKTWAKLTGANGADSLLLILTHVEKVWSDAERVKELEKLFLRKFRIKQ